MARLEATDVDDGPADGDGRPVVVDGRRGSCSRASQRIPSLILGQEASQSSPFSTNRNQLRSTSAECRTRPRRDRPEVGTAFCFSCSPVSPWHFMARVRAPVFEERDHRRTVAGHLGRVYALVITHRLMITGGPRRGPPRMEVGRGRTEAIHCRPRIRDEPQAPETLRARRTRTRRDLTAQTTE